MSKKFAFSDIKAEWEYAYNERLGLMIDGSDPPTPEQEREARLYADQHIQLVVYGHNLNQRQEF
jgi:hypothetical protein